MTTITFENLSATSEPFALDVGSHVLAITGDLAGATVILERNVPVHDGREVYAHVLPPFAEPGAGEFYIGPAAVGSYRLAVAPGSALPSITAVISIPPAGEAAA